MTHPVPVDERVLQDALPALGGVVLGGRGQAAPVVLDCQPLVIPSASRQHLLTSRAVQSPMGGRQSLGVSLRACACDAPPWHGALRHVQVRADERVESRKPPAPGVFVSPILLHVHAELHVALEGLVLPRRRLVHVEQQEQVVAATTASHSERRV